MDNLSDISGKNDFNINKAKILLIELLKADSKYYRNLIDEVNIMPENEFIELFNGNVEFNFSSSKKLYLQRLCYKINKFYNILYQWYEDETKYEYIKELWEKNIDIESLKIKNENDIFDYLSSEIKNFINWDDNIRRQLINLIHGTSIINNKIIEKIKQESEEIRKLMDEIAKFQKTFEEGLKKYKIDKDLKHKLFDLIRDNYSCAKDLSPFNDILDNEEKGNRKPLDITKYFNNYLNLCKFLCYRNIY